MGGGAITPFVPRRLRVCSGGQVQIATLLIWSVSRYFFALSSHGTLNNQNKSFGTLTKTFWYGKFSCQHIKACFYKVSVLIFATQIYKFLAGVKVLILCADHFILTGRRVTNLVLNVCFDFFSQDINQILKYSKE